MTEAHALGLDDFDRILNAIPVFARNYPDFFACLHQCLEELSQPEGVDGLPVRTNGWYNAPADADVIGELLILSCTCLDSKMGGMVGGSPGRKSGAATDATAEQTGS